MEIRGTIGTTRFGGATNCKGELAASYVWGCSERGEILHDGTKNDYKYRSGSDNEQREPNDVDERQPKGTGKAEHRSDGPRKYGRIGRN